MTLIIQTKTKSVKNPLTKTTYNIESVEKSLLTERQYNLTVKDDTLKWFRRLGGSETAQKSYTCFGYTCYKLTSISPNRNTRSIREFEFKSLSYREELKFQELFKSYNNGLFYLKRFKRGLTLAETLKILKSKTTK